MRKDLIVKIVLCIFLIFAGLVLQNDIVLSVDNQHYAGKCAFFAGFIFLGRTIVRAILENKEK